MVDSLHADEEVEDKTGYDDDGVRAVVTDLKESAGLSKFPNALAEGWLSFMMAHDKNAAAVILNKDQNPAAYTAMMKKAGFALKQDAANLVSLTKPSQALPDGLEPQDLLEMNDKDYDRLRRRMERGAAAARKGQRRR
jgi:hypothetical protein